MGNSLNAEEEVVVRFRIDPEKIGSTQKCLMHDDGWRLINVHCTPNLDALI